MTTAQSELRMVSGGERERESRQEMGILPDLKNERESVDQIGKEGQGHSEANRVASCQNRAIEPFCEAQEMVRYPMELRRCG